MNISNFFMRNMFVLLERKISIKKGEHIYVFMIFI